jgi:small-conductance mechanosensitive channel
LEADALEERVLQLRVYRALFVQDFLKLCVVVPRLHATRIALNSHDFLVWLALSGVPRVVSLALVKVAVAIALLVLVALGEAVVLLVLLVGPPCHHVMQFHGSRRAIASKVVVRVLREEPVLEAADDILIGNVGDGGARLEETWV